MEDEEAPHLIAPMYVNVPSGYGLVIDRNGDTWQVMNKVGRIYVDGKPVPIMDWQSEYVKPETGLQCFLRYIGLLKIA